MYFWQCKLLKMGKFGHHACTLAVIGVMALVGASAAAAATSRDTAHKAKYNVTIAYVAPAADQMVAEVAEKAGIFAKYGIDANVESLQQTLVFPAMVNGSVQYAVIAGPAPEVDSLGGTPLEFIGQWENANDVVIMANSSVGTSPSSANGKSIAISTAGALSDFTTQLYEHKYNIKLTEVPVGSLPNEDAAFASGSVQMLAAASPWQEATLEQQVKGAHVLEDLTKLHGYPAMGLVVDKTWASVHSAENVAVLEALAATVKYWRTHESQVVAVIAQYTSEPTDEATVAYKDVTKVLLPTIVPSLQDQKNVLKALVPFGYPAASSVNPKSLLNTTYATKAETLLNQKKRTKKK